MPAPIDVAQIVQSFLHPNRKNRQARPKPLGSTVTSAARGGPQVAIRAASMPMAGASSATSRTGITSGIAGPLGCQAGVAQS